MVDILLLALKGVHDLDLSLIADYFITTLFNDSTNRDFGKISFYKLANSDFMNWGFSKKYHSTDHIFGQRLIRQIMIRLNGHGN